MYRETTDSPDTGTDTDRQRKGYRQHIQKKGHIDKQDRQQKDKQTDRQTAQRADTETDSLRTEKKDRKDRQDKKGTDRQL